MGQHCCNDENVRKGVTIEPPNKKLPPEDEDKDAIEEELKEIDNFIGNHDQQYYSYYYSYSPPPPPHPSPYYINFPANYKETLSFIETCNKHFNNSR